MFRFFSLLFRPRYNWCLERTGEDSGDRTCLHLRYGLFSFQRHVWRNHQFSGKEAIAVAKHDLVVQERKRLNEKQAFKTLVQETNTDAVV